MAAPATPTFILNWTNIWYKKLDRAHNASILASATLSDMRFETTGGDSVAQPFTLNGHRGDSGNFQAAQAVASQSEFRNSAKYRWQVPYSEYHGSIQIAHRDIALSRTDRDAVLSDARARLFDIVNGIERGEFPARPYETRICSYCAYASVCRKDYVGDD